MESHRAQASFQAVEFANPDSSRDRVETHALKLIPFLRMLFFINRNVFLIRISKGTFPASYLLQLSLLFQSNGGIRCLLLITAKDLFEQEREGSAADRSDGWMCGTAAGCVRHHLHRSIKDS